MNEGEIADNAEQADGQQGRRLNQQGSARREDGGGPLAKHVKRAAHGEAADNDQQMLAQGGGRQLEIAAAGQEQRQQAGIEPG